MHHVAVTRLESTLDDEARALAIDLGSLAYDARLRIVGGLPAVVLSSPDVERARALVVALRGRGNDALLVEATDVIATEAMIAPRRFRFDADALVATEGVEARVRWDDIVGIVRAIHRSTVETRETVDIDAFVPPRSARRTRRRTVTSNVEDPVAYLYLRAGTPWCLHAHRIRYGGDELAPSATTNLDITIGRLLERAPRASFDDRLVSRKVNARQADLLAHVLVRSWAPSRL